MTTQELDNLQKRLDRIASIMRHYDQKYGKAKRLYFRQWEQISIERLRKDEDGFYIHSENYQQLKEDAIAARMEREVMQLGTF